MLESPNVGCFLRPRESTFISNQKLNMLSFNSILYSIKSRNKNIIDKPKGKYQFQKIKIQCLFGFLPADLILTQICWTLSIRSSQIKSKINAQKVKFGNDLVQLTLMFT